MATSKTYAFYSRVLGDIEWTVPARKQMASPKTPSFQRMFDRDNYVISNLMNIGTDSRGGTSVIATGVDFDRAEDLNLLTCTYTEIAYVAGVEPQRVAAVAADITDLHRTRRSNDDGLLAAGESDIELELAGVTDVAEGDMLVSKIPDVSIDDLMGMAIDMGAKNISFGKQSSKNFGSIHDMQDDIDARNQRIADRGGRLQK